MWPGPITYLCINNEYESSALLENCFATQRRVVKIDVAREVPNLKINKWTIGNIYNYNMFSL